MSSAKREGQAVSTLRLDKWLWHARFVKSRTLAAKLCQSGRVRLNADRVLRPHHAVKCGDVLTFPLGPHIRVIKIVELGIRRGPASEAQTLYEDLVPPKRQTRSRPVLLGEGKRKPGAGRPTKAERRAINDLMGHGR